MKDANKLNQLVELTFQGIDLKPSRPAVTFQVRVYCESNGHRYMAGETEFVPATNNPDFKKRVRLDYLPNCHQKLEFFIAETDNPTLPPVGKTDIEFSVVMDAEVGLTLPLMDTGNLIGQMYLQHKAVVDDRSSYHMGFNCIEVKDVDFFTTSDPFVRMFRPTDIYITAISKDDIPEKAWLLLHQTEYVSGDLNPKFQPFAISKWNFCRSNPDAIIRFEIWDHSRLGMHKKISTAFTTLGRIQNGTDKCLNTYDEKSKFAGGIYFNLFEEKKFYMFDQYIDAGVQLRLMMAVDCSLSTKDMHKINSDCIPDLFEIAIKQVSTVLIAKEKTHRFGFLGFGAKVDGLKHPTFAFNQAESKRNPSVSSVNHALELYRSVYPQIEPEEQANLSSVIERVHFMMKHQDKRDFKVYTLLVVLTDGQVSDEQAVIDKIVECSNYPLSIVMVGVGQGNFDYFEFLETGMKLSEQTEKPKKNKKDKEEMGSPRKKFVKRLKSSKGEEAFRRIVRFVHFPNYLGKPKELEDALLRDVPRQMTEFYNYMKFHPGKKPQSIDATSTTMSSTFLL